MKTFWRLLSLLRLYRRGVIVSWMLASLAIVGVVSSETRHSARDRTATNR